MGHPAGLAWLSLSTRNESVPPARRSVSHSITTVPEFRRDPMVDYVPQHMGSSAVFNQPECIATELEIVAALINAVGPMPLDIDAAFHVGNELIIRRLAGLQSDIGDAHDRDMCPSVSSIGAT